MSTEKQMLKLKSLVTQPEDFTEVPQQEKKRKLDKKSAYKNSQDEESEESEKVDITIFIIKDLGRSLGCRKKHYEKLVKDEEWLKKYKGKFIAIDKNGKVVISEDDQRIRNTKVLQLDFQPYVVVAGIGPIHIKTYTVNCTLGVPPPATNTLNKFVVVNVGNTAATATNPVTLQMDEGADYTWLPDNMIKGDLVLLHYLLLNIFSCAVWRSGVDGLFVLLVIHFIHGMRIFKTL